jgi:hypothetical protein
MKSLVSLCAAAVVCLVASAAQAQESPFDALPRFEPRPVVAPASLDGDRLKSMLADIGYEPQLLSVSGYTAYKITLRHTDGTRTHMVAIDPGTKNVTIVGGGFASAPDVGRASGTWYRKLARINNSISPRTIFINDTDVLGMTSIRANVDISTSELRKFIEEHVAQFDKHLVPLAGELPSGVPVAARY